MAKKATSRAGAAATAKKGTKGKLAKSETRSSGGRSPENLGDALIKLLQSPLIAELVAVAATAALASLAEQGFTGREGSRGKRAGKAVKAAGKAAAAAVGRRLGSEIDEIRKASKETRSGAKG